MTSPQQKQYLRIADIRRRLGGISGQMFWRLRQNPDPKRRFPAPTMILGRNMPLWAIEVVEQYEREQKEYSKARTTVGPFGYGEE